MNKKLIGILLASSLASPLAYAENSPSYSFVEAGYISYDDSDLKTTGVKVKGSIELGESFFAVIDSSNHSGDINGFDIDFSTTGYGIGAKIDLQDDASIFASYTLNNWKIKDLGSDVDINTIRVGYRKNISNNVELNISYTSNDFETIDKESGYQAGMLYSISSTFQISFDYEAIDSSKIIFVGGRLNF